MSIGAFLPHRGFCQWTPLEPNTITTIIMQLVRTDGGSIGMLACLHEEVWCCATRIVQHCSMMHFNSKHRDTRTGAASDTSTQYAVHHGTKDDAQEPQRKIPYQDHAPALGSPSQDRSHYSRVANSPQFQDTRLKHSSTTAIPSTIAIYMHTNLDS
jgi:hypothetical protein